MEILAEHQEDVRTIILHSYSFT